MIIDGKKIKEKILQEVKAEVDPYKKIEAEFKSSAALKQLDYEYNVKEKMLQAELDLALGKNKGNSSSGESNESQQSSGEGSLIPDVPSDTPKKTKITYEKIDYTLLKLVFSDRIAASSGSKMDQPVRRKNL